MDIQSFYGPLLNQFDQYPLIRIHLSQIADRMFEGVSQKKDIVFKEINNYHPEHLGRPVEELKKINFTIEDCRTAIAHEYGFKNWDTIKLSNLEYDSTFEKTVDQLINGDFNALKHSIRKNPDVVLKRSGYGHQATLLHYAASNGVEMWRQKAPNNLPEMTKFLISSGANVKAKMKVYGGYFDTITLLKSSIHPFNAGIGEEMIKILERTY
ncbi:hypothetical protein [Aquimarina litoralis]|uniref:hypothetical protein n=1 Tax=Aquimarina litoralis TaxID=584605 RepID=UPI001C573F26|nr:hypothetical protein [Aquimarina litoralis]MBW1297582.1 hypothetical protein [Aquimarina litoralis]